jgi:hypothetical protein
MSQPSPEEYFGSPADYVLFTRLGAMGMEGFAVAFVMMGPSATRLVGLGAATLGALIYADGNRVRTSAVESDQVTEDLE